MSTIEDRLRDAYRAATETIQPETIPDLPGLAKRPAHSPAKSRRARALIPLAAAASVAAIVAALALASPLGAGNGQPGGTAVLPPGMPRFFVQVVSKNLLQVHETATGTVAASITPPRGTYFDGLVAATAGDRTFLTTVSPGSGVPLRGLPSPKTCVTEFYKFRLNDAGQPGPLTSLHITVPANDYLFNNISVTPDGRTIAYAPNLDCAAQTRMGVRLINVSTGQVRSWSLDIGSVITSVALSADGRQLSFTQIPISHFPGTPGARILPTNAPAGPADQHSRLVVRGAYWAAPNADGSSLYTCQPAESIYPGSGNPVGATTTSYDVYSIVSGRREVVASWRAQGFCAASLDASGRYLLVALGSGSPPAQYRLVVLDLRTRKITNIPSRHLSPGGGLLAAPTIAW